MAKFSSLLTVLLLAVSMTSAMPTTVASDSGTELSNDVGSRDLVDPVYESFATRNVEDESFIATEDLDIDLDIEEFQNNNDEDNEDDEVNDHNATNATQSLDRREVCNIPSAPDMKVVDIMYSVARGRKVTSKVMLAMFETAAVESRIHNLNCGDRDSIGVFQQRPSQGWGTVKQILDVKYSTNKFLDRAIPKDKAHPGFSAGQLAQSVQVSAFPDRYDAEKAKSQKLIKTAASRYKGKGNPAPKPKPKPKPSKSKCARTHKVKKGDTCIGLAKGNKISLNRFFQLNKGVHHNCDNLKIDQTYCVRG
ncbi:hypothetical protein BKA62DRAFT_753433 [Auriculariales sp. MPI-PUGE-AT-0066]|nr:hypothetical protein BKA62DRAFT_753433 [Auriculariales sp. MPI-PUGE-AT-0066]